MKSDEQLMLAYVSGDRGAFEELFSRYAPKLQRVFSRRTNGDDEARDLVQQTFLQLHRARLDYDAGRAFRPWLFTIALNLHREHLRRRRRRPEIIGDLEVDGFRSPTDGAARSNAARDVHRALDALPNAQREVIALHWFAGLGFAEIAEIVGAGLAATKIRAHRGYVRLRELLQEPEANALSGNQPRLRGIH
jgi:RNA polymerase sigma factor (sigma-70 family)